MDVKEGVCQIGRRILAIADAAEGGANSEFAYQVAQLTLGIPQESVMQVQSAVDAVHTYADDPEMLRIIGQGLIDRAIGATDTQEETE